nr:phage major capsid protein [Bacteroidota bacterium]
MNHKENENENEEEAAPEEATDEGADDSADETEGEEAPAEESADEGDKESEGDEPTDEDPEEAAKKAGQIMGKEIGEEVAKKIAEATNRLVKTSDKNKANKIVPNKGGSYDPEMKIFSTPQGKKDVKMKKSDIEKIGNYFKAFMNRDFVEARKWLAKAEPLNLGTTTDGGFLVPTILSNILVPLLQDETIVRPRATVLEVTGGQLDISNVATLPKVAWSGREQLSEYKSTASMTFGSNSLTPYTLAAIISLTKQLRNSTPFNIVKIVSQALLEGISVEEDRAFTVGTGAGQPTGWSTYGFPAINAGGNLAFNHLNSAWFRMPAPYRRRAVWIGNSRTVADLHNLIDANNRPIIDVAQNGEMRFRGATILEQNDLASDDFYLVDLSFYYIGDKPGGIALDMADQAIAGTNANGTDLNLWLQNMISLRAERE